MKLNEICEVYSGYAIKEFNNIKNGLPVIKIGNIHSDGRLNLGECQFSMEDINEKYHSKKGDIYIALSGATTGKLGIMEDEKKFIINQRVGVIRLKQKSISQSYIKYYLLKQTERIIDEATGCAQPNISPKQIGEYDIPVFSEKEMLQISNVLNNIECIIKYYKAMLEKYDDLIKARFIELFGDPQCNPHGYKHTKLSDIATYYNGLTYKPENVAEEGTIVLRSSNIQNSQLDFVDTVRVDCAIKELLMVQKNDILMCSRNGSAKLVGKVALIKNIQEPMSFGAFMMIIRSNYFGYLMTYFQMDAFRQQIKTGATTTINQITGRMLDDVTIPLPPMVLVDQFVAFVEQVDKSKLAVQQSLEKTQQLFDSLMQEYFG